MEEGQLKTIHSWFETLTKEMKKELSVIHEEMATKQQVENRYQALLNAITNLHGRVENYKNQQDQEIILIKRAIEGNRIGLWP